MCLLDILSGVSGYPHYIIFHFRKQFTVSTALWESLRDDLNIMFTALRDFFGVTLYIAMYM